MAVPTTMQDLSTTESSNSPAGSENPISTDNFHRAIQSILRHTETKGADIASATTTNLVTATGAWVDVTGTTTITGFGTVAAGITRIVRFTGALTLTHNGTSLILPGAANITTVNGDCAEFRSLGSGNWKCLWYTRGAGGCIGLVPGTDVEAYSAARTQTIWVPAGAMTSRTTNGAAVGIVESTTNKVMIRTLDFDATTQEYAQFSIQMPKSWNESTVTFQAVWSHAATVTNFGVVWELAGLARSDDDALDTAFGTAQTSTDTGGTTDDLYRSPASSAITIGGTPAENDVVIFQIGRKVADAGDTMAIDARLHGIEIFYTITTLTDA